MTESTDMYGALTLLSLEPLLKIILYLACFDYMFVLAVICLSLRRL